MSKRYTPEEKAAALAKLQANRWNVALTSVQLGIPQRTLTWWRQLLRLEEKLLPSPPPQ